MSEQIILFVAGFVLGALIVGIIYWQFNVSKGPAKIQKNINDFLDDLKLNQGKVEEQFTNFTNAGTELNKSAQNMQNIFLKGGSERIGRIGEWQLKNILEKMELRQNEEYHLEKAYYDTENTRYILDAIIHLPGNRDVIIDSKVSLSGWEEYVNAENEEEKKSGLENHIKLVRNKISSLSEKKYQNLKGINTIDAVLMFMPNEFMFSVISKNDKKLKKSIIDEALEKKIIPVGPISLYAYLSIIVNAWANFKQNKDTKKIIESFSDVYDRMTNVYKSFEDAKKNIINAQEFMETAETRTIAVTKKLSNYKEEFNIPTNKELPDSAKESKE